MAENMISRSHVAPTPLYKPIMPFSFSSCKAMVDALILAAPGLLAGTCRITTSIIIIASYAQLTNCLNQINY